MTAPMTRTPASALDEETTHLVRIAAAVAGSDEQSMRVVFKAAQPATDQVRVEEVILQSYLFAGFPRALNAARIWRALTPSLGATEPASTPGATDAVRAAGERTCSIVYGESYEKLRGNMRDLHPAFDTWMIEDGYGKVLSRPGLDLKRRELCVVAACAATAQRRQLHSHIRGALNSGASSAEIGGVFDAVVGLAPPSELADGRQLLAHISRS